MLAVAARGSPECHQLTQGAGAAWPHTGVDAPSAWPTGEAPGGTHFTPPAPVGMSQAPLP